MKKSQLHKIAYYFIMFAWGVPMLIFFCKALNGNSTSLYLTCCGIMGVLCFAGCFYLDEYASKMRKTLEEKEEKANESYEVFKKAKNKLTSFVYRGHVDILNDVIEAIKLRYKNNSINLGTCEKNCEKEYDDCCLKWIKTWEKYDQALTDIINDIEQLKPKEK